ncbi:MAG: bifunctional riboflavin kinase/FAD synthetase [Gammaproteobacteria bacterium]|nr:bifunctional riboflavin kinase/FAD synthetase [Gammaproteobacteria bacterium]
MELIRGQHNLRQSHRGCVATIGNFDGVHLGHQAVLGQLAERATAEGLPALAVIFEPHPIEFFRPQQAPPRIMRLREKLQALRDHGLDRVLVLNFDQPLAAMSATTFISEMLVAALGIRHLVVGEDFRFGHQRAGDFTMLAAAGPQGGFSVAKTPVVRIGENRVSSTGVRRLLQAGALDQAAACLGRPYSITGRVRHGDKRGRTIGFPTANIGLHRVSACLSGVYAVEVDGIDGQPVPGMANVGSRPTVGGARPLLEVNLFDFQGDLYGRYLHVNFVKKLRDETRFDSFDGLRQQLVDDARLARKLLIPTTPAATPQTPDTLPDNSA